MNLRDLTSSDLWDTDVILILLRSFVAPLLRMTKTATPLVILIRLVILTPLVILIRFVILTPLVILSEAKNLSIQSRQGKRWSWSMWSFPENPVT